MYPAICGFAGPWKRSARRGRCSLAGCTGSATGGWALGETVCCAAAEGESGRGRGFSQPLDRWGYPQKTRSQWIVMGGPRAPKIRRSWYILVVTGIVGEGGWQDGPQIITHPQ